MKNQNKTIPCPFCAEDIDISAESCPFCSESLARSRLKYCPFCAELIPRKIKDSCPFCNSLLPGGKRQVKIKFPVITALIIAACVIVYCKTSGNLLTGSSAMEIFDAGGITNASIRENGEYYRLFTSLFLHFSLIHLLCNIFILYSAGKCVENIFGWWKFIGIYLVSGLGGSVLTLQLGADNTVSAGASGAIFGLIGALLGYLLRHHRQLPTGERNRLYGSVAWFFIANTGFALWFNSASEGMKIGIEAHTGGFIAGMLAGLLLTAGVCRKDELAEFADDL